jgi:hypothetical protein
LLRCQILRTEFFFCKQLLASVLSRHGTDGSPASIVPLPLPRRICAAGGDAGSRRRSRPASSTSYSWRGKEDLDADCRLSLASPPRVAGGGLEDTRDLEAGLTPDLPARWDDEFYGGSSCRHTWLAARDRVRTLDGWRLACIILLLVAFLQFDERASSLLPWLGFCVASCFLPGRHSSCTYGAGERPMHTYYSDLGLFFFNFDRKGSFIVVLVRVCLAASSAFDLRLENICK